MTRSKLGRIYRITFAALMTLAAAPPLARGAGEDSPASASGVFNGNITTAGDYDPYSGNIRRVVDDMVVPGCVGAYPLKLTRYYNSRAPNSLAGPAQWVHSYQWGYGPGSVIYYPDGRAGTPDTDQAISPSPTAPGDTLDANGCLVQSDGGKVCFGTNGQATQIIDPYGQITTIQYAGAFVSKVTEPGGRYLQFSYVTKPNGIVVPQSVQAFAAAGGPMIDSVTYTYMQTPVMYMASDPMS